MLDLAIVGAGPAGLATAIAARRAGLRYRAFDKGGVVAALERVPLHIVFSSTSERLEIGGIPFITRGPRPTRDELLTYYRTVAWREGLDLALYTEVTSVERADPRPAGGFRLRLRGVLNGREDEVLARAVVVATGYFDHPNRLGVPGEDLPKASHYFTHGHPYFGLDVAVVGGQNSAAEAALELWRAGARVVLIHRGPDLSPKVKPWVLPDIRSRIEKGEIKALFSTRLLAIGPDRLWLRLDGEGGEEVELPNDFVFLLTGYRAEAPLLGGLGVGRDPVSGVPRHDPDTLETEVPGVYVAGVVAAGFDANAIFIENARFHGERIVSHLLRRLRREVRAGG
ncbi:MAG: YpdA family putative bacillithiol disulfide reductase [Clostridia bacterium]|nr:YpdA family putative bacillithiol disulfide reductase [Clostridia bacterium]